ATRRGTGATPADARRSVSMSSGQTGSARGLGAAIVRTPARAITPAEATAAAEAGEIALSASRPIAPTVDQTHALATGQLEQAAALADSLARARGGAMVGQLRPWTATILNVARLLGGVDRAVRSGSA